MLHFYDLPCIDAYGKPHINPYQISCNTPRCVRKYMRRFIAAELEEHQKPSEEPKLVLRFQARDGWPRLVTCGHLLFGCS